MSRVSLVGAAHSALTRAVGDALAAAGHDVADAIAGAEGTADLIVAAAPAVADRPAVGRRVLVVDGPDPILVPGGEGDAPSLGAAPVAVPVGDGAYRLSARLGDGYDVEVRVSTSADRTPVTIRLDGRPALTAMLRAAAGPVTLTVPVEGRGVLHPVELAVEPAGPVRVEHVRFPGRRRGEPGARWWDGDAVVAASEVARRWLAHAWGVDATVLTPPVDLPAPGGPKDDVIVVPGPFNPPEAPAYKQGELIGVYQVLVERGHVPGWELHVVGPVAPGGDKAVTRAEARLREAPGATLHLDPAREDEDELLRRAAICWSAVGIGEDPVAEVEAFDPLGTPVLRAMAAGAVPVVVRGAAADGWVEHRVNGLVVPSFALLIAATEELAADADLRSRLGAAAAETARAFGADTFAARTAAVVAPLLAR